jgi:hypothetical protein
MTKDESKTHLGEMGSSCRKVKHDEQWNRVCRCEHEQKLSHRSRRNVLSESEFCCDSKSGTEAAVNTLNVLVDDLSSCDGQTHAEEECGLGLYRPRSANSSKGDSPILLI